MKNSQNTRTIASLLRQKGTGFFYNDTDLIRAANTLDKHSDDVDQTINTKNVIIVIMLAVILGVILNKNSDKVIDVSVSLILRLANAIYSGDTNKTCNVIAEKLCDTLLKHSP